MTKSQFQEVIETAKFVLRNYVSEHSDVAASSTYTDKQKQMHRFETEDKITGAVMMAKQLVYAYMLTDGSYTSGEDEEARLSIEKMGSIYRDKLEK